MNFIGKKRQLVRTEILIYFEINLKNDFQKCLGDF